MFSPYVSISEGYDSGRAALLGVRLVSQVLEEALVVANAAKESGQPWQYLAMIRNLDPGNLGVLADDSISFVASGNLSGLADDSKSFVASRGDGIMEKNTNQGSSIATSTPQKNNDETLHHKPESSFIGQGDEDVDESANDCSNSMFINQLYDMSSVEKVIDEDTIRTDPVGPDSLSQDITKIMDSYVNTAFNIAFDQEQQTKIVEIQDQQLTTVTEINDHPLTELVELEDQETAEAAKCAEQTCLSFLAKALGENGSRDIEDNDDEEKIIQVLEDDDGNPPEIVVEEIIDEQSGIRDVIIIEEYTTDCQDENESTPKEATIHLDEPLEGNVVVTEADVNDILENNDVIQYGNMYSTLNRDYEQRSEEDVPVLRGLQDTQEMMAMQEIELMTSATPEENLSPKADIVKENNPRELAATSNVSALSGKSSLSKRFRSQGARLLSCLRGWWRRKTPGKRKETLRRSHHGSILGLCPLSPKARQVASALDQCQLYSPAASHPPGWKFNTINETVVNTVRYKDYTFDKTEECKV